MGKLQTKVFPSIGYPAFSRSGQVQRGLTSSPYAASVTGASMQVDSTNSSHFSIASRISGR